MTEAQSDVLLTTADLRRWEEECERLASEIRELEGKRATLATRLQAVRDLLSELGVRRSPDNLLQAQPPIMPAQHQARRTRGPVTWMQEIMRILSGEKDGATYDDLRAGIELGPLAQRLRESDKGLYGGVGKLEQRGELIKHKGRLFSSQNFSDYKRRVELGEADEFPAPPGNLRPSEMGDAILLFLRQYPNGIESGAIVDALRRNPKFSATVTRNKTSAYNVIKRLLDRRQISKSGGRYYPLELERHVGGEPQAPSVTGHEEARQSPSSNENGPEVAPSGPDDGGSLPLTNPSPSEGATKGW